MGIKLSRMVTYFQSWTKYIETFSRFNTISLHHKWNATRLLSSHTYIWYISKSTILHFSVKYKFGTKRPSNCSRVVIMKRLQFFLLKTYHWESPETIQKLCLSTKFPNQKIRWNYDIFHSVSFLELRCFFKGVKTKRKIFGQSLTKYLETVFKF